MRNLKKKIQIRFEPRCLCGNTSRWANTSRSGWYGNGLKSCAYPGCPNKVCKRKSSDDPKVFECRTNCNKCKKWKCNFHKFSNECCSRNITASIEKDEHGVPKLGMINTAPQIPDRRFGPPPTFFNDLTENERYAHFVKERKDKETSKRTGELEKKFEKIISKYDLYDYDDGSHVKGETAKDKKRRLARAEATKATIFVKRNIREWQNTSLPFTDILDELCCMWGEQADMPLMPNSWTCTNKQCLTVNYSDTCQDCASPKILPCWFDHDLSRRRRLMKRLCRLQGEPIHF